MKDVAKKSATIKLDGKISEFVKSNPAWRRLNKMDKEITAVFKEFVKYSDFLIKMQKIVADTEMEIDLEDPEWREREHITIFGHQTATWKSPFSKYKRMEATNPQVFKMTDTNGMRIKDDFDLDNVSVYQQKIQEVQEMLLEELYENTSAPSLDRKFGSIDRFNKPTDISLS